MPLSPLCFEPSITRRHLVKAIDDGDDVDIDDVDDDDDDDEDDDDDDDDDDNKDEDEDKDDDVDNWRDASPSTAPIYPRGC